MDIDVGRVIAGKYELVRLLGKGAMGEVWLATHNSLGGEFAVKLVETTGDVEAATASGRFQLEAQIAAKLSRKTRHIVSVSDHGEEGKTAYLVMENLEGESLEARLRRMGPLDLAETAAIVMQIGRALALAHDEGIFHRDLKPANIFLTKDEDGRLLVKLLDFGIARAMKPFKTRSPFATSRDMVLGTPSYMSPEQARGLDSLDHRCDLWALATCAYECLAGRIPFEGDTVEEIFLNICMFRVVPLESLRAEIAPEVEAFFAKAFANELDERFARARELSDAFEALVDRAALEPYLGAAGASSIRRLPMPPQGSVVSSTAKMPTQLPATIETGSTAAVAGLPKRPRGGILIISGAIAAALVVVVAGLAVRASQTKDANAAEPAPTRASAPPVTLGDRNDVRKPPPDPEATSEAEVATAATAAATAPPPKKDARKLTRPTAGTVAPAQPTITPAPPPPLATTPSKKLPHDKGEVF